MNENASDSHVRTVDHAFALALAARPAPRTQAAEDFLSGLHGCVRTLADTQAAVQEFERLAKFADGVMELVSPDHQMREDLANSVKQLKAVTSSSWRIHRRRMLTEVIDNYLTYLADLAAQVMRAKPETMRSRAEVSLADVLAHSTMEDFIEWVSEREVTRLTTGGLPDVVEFFERRFGLEVTSEPDKMELLRYATLVRNLYTHRRGVVDSRFLKAAGGHATSDGLQLGRPWHAGSDFFFEVVTASVQSALELDAQAMSKFGLSSLSDPHGAECVGCADT